MTIFLVKIILNLLLGFFIFFWVGIPFILNMALSNSGGTRLDDIWLLVAFIIASVVTIYRLDSLIKKNQSLTIQIQSLGSRVNNIPMKWRIRWLITVIFLTSSALVFWIILSLDAKYFRIDHTIDQFVNSQIISIPLQDGWVQKLSLWDANQIYFNEVAEQEVVHSSLSYTNEQKYIIGEQRSMNDRVVFKVLILIWTIVVLWGWLLCMLVVKTLKITGIIG